MFPLRKIVSPTDFSEASQFGLKAAIEMAEKFEAELIVVHVIASVPVIAGTYSMSGAHAVDLVESMQTEARRQMDRLLESIPDALRCDVRLIQGQPAEEITRLAAQEKADIIVIATHGYSGFNRFLFGSIAERVVRTATCPVLTIRPPEAE
jgi:nucleotide-binding universal stress UspA family protein